MKNKIVFITLISILVSCKKEEKIKSAVQNNDTIETIKDSIKAPKTIKGNDSITCIDVVLKVLTTAPSYVQRTKGLYEAIVKNGGTSFGITVEGSPNPEIDKALNYSETYDLNLHETYPDRMPTIARYTFDPSKNKLYQYDVAEDTLRPIDFNEDLLLEYRKVCK